MSGLVLSHVSKAFGGLKATDDVSFSLSSGQSVALIGPNGAGKSTLVQLISGIERPDSGTIELEGERIDHLSPDRLARRGLLRSFQTSRVFPALTVWESVLVGTQARVLSSGGHGLINPASETFAALLRTPSWRRRNAEQAERAEEVLKLFGERLWPRRDQPAFSLSYANRRRLEIARLLVAEPRFLLLDEPTAGMNPTETEEMTTLLLDLRQLYPQLGMLVIEHKLSLVRRIADRVVVLNQGRVLLEDTPSHALDHPEVVEAYLGRARTKERFADAHLG
ncbi:ABC transporter ATP-binding protein [Terrihabitans sp. B22-R8]|uniref:ABC transporter ATP-binding protein n=1 Tax=Terrihabitans sp. B22-R8 TaxID=3425128 RepID=UPI00403CA576